MERREGTCMLLAVSVCHEVMGGLEGEWVGQPGRVGLRGGGGRRRGGGDIKEIRPTMLNLSTSIQCTVGVKKSSHLLSIQRYTIVMVF